MFSSHFERLSQKLMNEFPNRIESVSCQMGNCPKDTMVIAQFTDQHDEPYFYDSMPMPTGGLFILKIFSEKNVAVYDKQRNVWRQIVYARTFLEHWKIVG